MNAIRTQIKSCNKPCTLVGSEMHGLHEFIQFNHMLFPSFGPLMSLHSCDTHETGCDKKNSPFNQPLTYHSFVIYVCAFSNRLPFTIRIAIWLDGIEGPFYYDFQSNLLLLLKCKSPHFALPRRR